MGTQQVSFSVAYLVFISRNFLQLYGFNKDPVVLACLPALILLCMLRHMKYLAPFSLFAESVNILGVLVVFFADMQHMHRRQHQQTHSAPVVIELAVWQSECTYCSRLFDSMCGTVMSRNAL